MFTTINRTKNWMKTIFLSTVISLSVCLYIKIHPDKSLIPLFLRTTNKKSQHTFPCVSFCALELFDELYEEPIRQNIKNLTRNPAHNYLMLWWNGWTCKEKLLRVNFTEIRVRLRENFIPSCIPSTSIIKNCYAINSDAPWDYLEPLCYTLNFQQEYEDILHETLLPTFKLL